MVTMVTFEVGQTVFCIKSWLQPTGDQGVECGGLHMNNPTGSYRCGLTGGSVPLKVGSEVSNTIVGPASHSLPVDSNVEL